MRLYLFFMFCFASNLGQSYNKSIWQQLSFFNSSFPSLKLMEPIRLVLPLNFDLISMKAIDRCYDEWLNGMQVNMFQPNISTFQIFHHYYVSFLQTCIFILNILLFQQSQPTKNISLNSLENLIKSARTIAEHVIECIVKPKRYKLGFTSMSDLVLFLFDFYLMRLKMFVIFQNLEEYQNFMTDGEIVEHNETEIDNKRIAASCYTPATFHAPKSINWAAQGMVTPVRYQGTKCGSCWAFATVAALESAYLKTYKTRLDLSEQQLVDCSKSYDGCGTGTTLLAYNYIQSVGIVSEKSYPYQGAYQYCKSWMYPVAARIKQFCIRGLNFYHQAPGTVYERLTEKEIEKAVAYFGPITVCLNAELLAQYKGGVLDDERCSKQITHMVLLVGYTPYTWILKNSWGTHWGQKGYFQVARGKNMCNINFEISYPFV